MILNAGLNWAKYRIVWQRVEKVPDINTESGLVTKFISLQTFDYGFRITSDPCSFTDLSLELQESSSFWSVESFLACVGWTSSVHISSTFFMCSLWWVSGVMMILWSLEAYVITNSSFVWPNLQHCLHRGVQHCRQICPISLHLRHISCLPEMTTSVLKPYTFRSAGSCWLSGPSSGRMSLLGLLFQYLQLDLLFALISNDYVLLPFDDELFVRLDLDHCSSTSEGHHPYVAHLVWAQAQAVLPMDDGKDSFFEVACLVSPCGDVGM